MITEQDILDLVAIGKLRNSETDFQRIPMDVEHALMEKIRLGQYKEIHLASYDKLNANLGLMASTPLTQCTYLAVSAVALFSRKAIEGGASPDDVFNLSDALLYSLSCCKDQKDIYNIYQLSAVMFAKLVYAQKEKKHSYQVERILNFISGNIYKKITLEEIAEYIGLSQNYLCTLFAKETGLSIHNYIQREKIQISCNLLKYSDRSISDIASYMGFQTQSNFTAIFRKWIDLTPSEYRKLYYKEVF